MDDSDEEMFELPSQMDHPAFVHALEGMLSQMDRDSDPRVKAKPLTPSAQRAIEDEASKGSWSGYYDKDEVERKRREVKQRAQDEQRLRALEPTRQRKKLQVVDLSPQELVDAAKELKEEGNVAFKRKANQDAESCYKDAIVHLKEYRRHHTKIDGSAEVPLTLEADELMLQCHLNIAEAYLRRGKWQSALRATQWVLGQQQHARNPKALFRGARARRMMGRELHLAKRDLALAIRVKPGAAALRREWALLRDAYAGGAEAVATKRHFMSEGLGIDAQLEVRQQRQRLEQESVMLQPDMVGKEEDGQQRATGRCAICGLVCESLCAGCSSRWYCDERCQVKDWTGGHKSKCARLQEKHLELLAFAAQMEQEA